jgi:hypothetical protein
MQAMPIIEIKHEQITKQKSCPTLDLKSFYTVPTKWAKGKRCSVYEVGTGTGYSDFNDSDGTHQQKAAS